MLQQVHDATEARQLGVRVRGLRSGRRPGPAAARAAPPPPVSRRWSGSACATNPREVDAADAAGRGRAAAARRGARTGPTTSTRDAVAVVRDHIAAGETYQCNLTDRLRSTVAGDPQALYARLALAQRGAYNAYLDLGRHVVASASPELFFEWAGDSRADAAR